MCVGIYMCQRKCSWCVNGMRACKCAARAYCIDDVCARRRARAECGARVRGECGEVVCRARRPSRKESERARGTISRDEWTGGFGR